MTSPPPEESKNSFLSYPRRRTGNQNNNDEEQRDHDDEQDHFENEDSDHHHMQQEDVVTTTQWYNSGRDLLRQLAAPQGSSTGALRTTMMQTEGFSTNIGNTDTLVARTIFLIDQVLELVNDETDDDNGEDNVKTRDVFFLWQ